MKAEIKQIGTVSEHGIDNWSFDGHGGGPDDFTREDGETSILGWSLAELREISKAAQSCPLYKLGALLRLPAYPTR